jgi:hypothetical protein
MNEEELIKKECNDFKESVIKRIERNKVSLDLSKFISNIDKTTEALSENIPILEKRLEDIINKSSKDKSYLINISNELKKKASDDVINYFLG